MRIKDMSLLSGESESLFKGLSPSQHIGVRWFLYQFSSWDNVLTMEQQWNRVFHILSRLIKICAEGRNGDQIIIAVVELGSERRHF